MLLRRGARLLPVYLVAEKSAGQCEQKKDSDAIVDISEIKKGEPVSLFIIQVAAPSWAATQLPEITLASQSCLKNRVLKAVQVEHSVMIGS